MPASTPLSLTIRHPSYRVKFLSSSAFKAGSVFVDDEQHILKKRAFAIPFSHRLLAQYLYVRQRLF